MENLFNTKLIKSIMPYFLLAVFVIIVYKVIDRLHLFVGFAHLVWGIITPFFFGFILAYILNIPCSGIQKLLGKSKSMFFKKQKKTISIFSVYLLSGLIIYLVLDLVIPYVYTNTYHFIRNFPIDRASDSVQQLINMINNLEFIRVEITMDEILLWVSENFNIQNSLSASFNAIISTSFNAIFSLSSLVFQTFLAVISSVFILFEKDKFKTFLSRLLWIFSSKETYSMIIKYAQKLNKYFRQYINTQTIDGLILGTIAALELSLMGSLYALTLGIMLGILNYIPYFGSIFGTLIAVVVVTLTQGYEMGLIATFVLFLTQQIDGNIIQPKLMGESFKFSPLLVIIGVTVGGAFAGVLGMIAAIPIVAVLKDILEDIMNHYERKKSEEKPRRRKTDYADFQRL